MTDPVTALPTGRSHGPTSTTARRSARRSHSAKAAASYVISPDDEVLQGLHLAEGIESALAGMAIGLRPMWATGSTALMAKFPVLSGIECLTIVVDQRRKRRRASARRTRSKRDGLKRAGRPASSIGTGSGDINDALESEGAERALKRS